MGESARDRARGALLGLASGDAVGTAVEFQPPGSFTPLTDMVGGGTFRLQAGQWTDDTSMALCLAESIVDTGGLDLVDNLRRYVAWWRHGYFSSTGSCFDIGGTTRSELRRFERTGEGANPSPSQESAANGSLMRLAPVPIAWHRDVAEAAERSGESSRSTHAADRPVDACRLYGAMVAAVIGGASLDEVLAPSFWRWGELHPHVAAIAAGSFRTKAPPEIKGSGFCIDALEAALWAVAGATDFRSAVLRAANLGDDADTTAAIAGQLAGAWWGESGIPPDWRSQITMRERITSLADALFDLHGSPAERWAFDDLVHAWWVEPGLLLAGEYPGRKNGDSAKLTALLDAGVRTFVDLTTPADPLTDYGPQLFELGAQRGLTVRRERFPIPDLGVTDASGYREVLDLMQTEMRLGRRVYVHCWGGVGRTGTVVGCHLVDQGLSPSEVPDRLRELRAGTSKANRPCPETPAQRAVVAAWGN